MKLVLIPLWLEQTLINKDLNLSTALSTEKLSTILSNDDLAFYISLNMNMSRWIPEEFINSFKSISFLDSISDEKYESIFDLTTEYNFRKGNDLIKRTSSELLGPTADVVETSLIGFKVKRIAEDTMALVPYVCNKDQKQCTNGFLTLADDLLLYLNEQLNFNEVAKLPIFKYFVTHSIV